MEKITLNYTNILPKLTPTDRNLFYVNKILSSYTILPLVILTFFINKLENTNCYIAFILSTC